MGQVHHRIDLYEKLKNPRVKARLFDQLMDEAAQGVAVSGETAALAASAHR